MLQGNVEALDGETVKLRLKGSEAVIATPTNGLHKGNAANLSIRPERITINPTGDQNSTLPVTLIETIYHGASAMMIFQLASGDKIIAQLRAGNPLLQMSNATEARVSFNSSDTLAFDNQGMTV